MGCNSGTQLKSLLPGASPSSLDLRSTRADDSTPRPAATQEAAAFRALRLEIGAGRVRAALKAGNRSVKREAWSVALHEPRSTMNDQRPPAGGFLRRAQELHREYGIPWTVFFTSYPPYVGAGAVYQWGASLESRS